LLGFAQPDSSLSAVGFHLQNIAQNNLFTIAKNQGVSDA
jgi:hypothetical protein